MSRQPEVAAFQGERGAFSEDAARKLLGDRLEFLPCPRFEDVFRSLAEGRATAAVVPIENTLHGSVHENYDHLLHNDLPIVGETNVRIVHNLIAPPGLPFSKVRKVYSHPVALNQCLKFFADHPEIEKAPFYDTAGSVKMVMEERPEGGAAIASAVAAKIYGGRILKRSIEDDRANFTRFFLLRRPSETPLADARGSVLGPVHRTATVRERPGKLPYSRRTKWKTSLVFSTRNTPGTLFRAMSALALRDLNLCKIESRPLRGKPWEYLFYVDFLGHTEEANVQNALHHLREVADFLRVLGCYPQGA